MSFRVGLGCSVQSGPHKWLSNDWKWEKHQLHPQGKIGCHLQAQGWIHSKRNLGCENCARVKRWKKRGLMIELFKTTRASMKFDRMIPSGSSWLTGIRVQRVFDQAHSAMEPGKTIFISKFHQITGHTGEHLLKPTANYMKLRLIGRLPPCEVCAQTKIRQRNVPKKKMKKLPNRPGYRVFMDICSFKQVSRGGNRHWLIVVDEFSDCTHRVFLKRKSVQIR